MPSTPACWRWPRCCCAILTLAPALAGFGAAIHLAVAQAADGFAARQGQCRHLYESHVAWARAHRFPLPDEQADFRNLVAIAMLQVGIGNFVRPWLQRRRLSLSPAVVIVALAFRSWVRGIGDALLFAGTRWIARLPRHE